MNTPAEALEFATVAHNGQKRKYTGDDYIVHPIEVASIVTEAFARGITVATLEHCQKLAYLHDTVEDCGVTFSEIYTRFGQEVGDDLYWLTDTISKEMGGNRHARKRLAAIKFIGAPVAPLITKLADFISNTTSIVQHDPDFARVYLREKKFALECIQKGLIRHMAYEAGIVYLLQRANANTFA